ncbi:MAG TPA: glycosyltransferase family 4 protein [Tepidisphaeraceae bacterium]|jgi:glycosyltransferase involved in cell wall biosynthesis|nr:glycosyltransferase family 4 protein [Tepidisphaeraceae bacterium]
MNASPPPRRQTLLVFSQTFVPDPASVGQHMADVAFEMARRGYRVRVFTSARGYEDARVKYPPRETLNGVEIRRLPLASFGKKSLALRVLGTAMFQLQCLLVGLFARRVRGIFFSTSPPLIGVIASILHIVRRVPIAYWAMDLNPDQLIALGKLKPTDFAARFLEAVNRLILRESSLIVALDRFMADRLEARGPLRRKMLVMPPWPHENHIESDGALASEENPFRARHGLSGKFVIMYSGNHSPSNPLATLLKAAVHFKDDPDVRFLFVGGGSGKREVEAVIAEHHLANSVSLPYQPLSELKHSLSAADVHVVALGDDMVGIIHPCKIYGAMAVGRPILYFGPRPSHVTDLLDVHGIGLPVAHGDVAGAIEAIGRFRSSPSAEMRRMGEMAKSVLRQTLGQQAQCAKFCDRLEQAFFSKD